jgi:VWFA-related protein
MKILSAVSALLLAAWTPVFSASPPTAPSFGEAMEVSIVNVDVYVTAKDGNRVTGLKKDDFAIFEDGKPVEVSNFAELSPPAVVREAPSAPPPVSEGAVAAGAVAPVTDPEHRLSLVVFLDNLHLRPEHRTRAVEQIRKFLLRNVRAGDRVMLVTYDVNLRTRHPLNEDRGSLDAALRGAETLPSYGQQEEQARRTAYETVINLYKLSGCTADIIAPVESYAQQTQTEALRTINALRFTTSSLSGVPGRKAVLYVSDGVSIMPGEELFEATADLCSGKLAQLGLPSPVVESKNGGGEIDKYEPSQAALDAQKYSVAKQFEDLAARASAGQVTFYTLQASGLRGSAAADVSYEASERLLQSGAIQQIQTNNLKSSLTALAVDTGGRAMLDANDFLPDLARMQEDFESYYSLSYSLAHAGDGKVHHIEVKMKRPGLRARYRQSYRDKPTLEKVADRTFAALFHGIEDNPLGIAIDIGEITPADGGQYSVPVRLKIPLFKLAILNRDKTYEGKLRLLVATRDETGGTSSMRQVQVPLSIPSKEVMNALGQYYVYTLTLKMKPGPQHVAVAVRDELAASTSYLTRPVNVNTTATVSYP